MKKYCVSILMAVLAIMCVTTFVSCGSDDEDDLPSQETGTVTFVEPCLEFGSSREYVKEYMSGSSWQLVEESNDYVLMYTDSKSTSTVTYSFIGSSRGLSMVAVNYITSKDTDATNKAETVYTGQSTIGGRTIAIVAHCTSASVSVLYKIPD